MQKLIFLLLLLVIVTACGNSQDFFISSSLKGYTQEFFAECEKHGVYNCKERFDRRMYSVEMVPELDENVFGLCRRNELDGTRRIYMSKKACDRFGATVCKVVLWHEYGHCLYGLEHTAEGVMRSYSYYTYNQEMLDEFFNDIKQVK